MDNINLSMSQYDPTQQTHGFVDVDQTLVFNLILQSGQTVNALQLPISGDGDFYLCGMQASSFISVGFNSQQVIGNAGIRIADDLGYRLSDDFLDFSFMSSMRGNSYPWMIRPAHLFKAGTRINIDLTETTGLGVNSPPYTNTVQILFRGRYRYKLSDIIVQNKLIVNAKRFQQGLPNAR